MLTSSKLTSCNAIFPFDVERRISSTCCIIGLPPLHSSCFLLYLADSNIIPYGDTSAALHGSCINITSGSFPEARWNAFCREWGSKFLL